MVGGMVFGLVGGLGLGLGLGFLLERRSSLVLLRGTTEVVERVVESVAVSVRYPGSRQLLSQPEPSEAQQLFDDLQVDVAAAPAWMMDDVETDQVAG